MLVGQPGQPLKPSTASRPGLVAALRRGFQARVIQRCRMHFARNLLANVPKDEVDAACNKTPRGVAARFHAQTADARGQGRGARMHRRHAAHWRKIWSTNGLEQVTRRSSAAPASAASSRTPPRAPGIG